MFKAWTSRRRKVKAASHGRLVAPETGDALISASIGPAGEVVALWSAAADLPELTARTTSPGGATFPGTRTSRPLAARVTTHAPGMAITTRISALSTTYPSVQPLPDGQVLVVGSRCRWRPEGPEHNATVYDSTGTVLLESTLGDGIEHVRTTCRGDVWVGYFDEGVYGNFGWGDADAPPPLGASGLTRFSPTLTGKWQFPSETGWGPIDDCYALNVADDVVWACYYSDFPVVRIHNGTVTGWRNDDVHGAKAIAADGSRIALYGGYGPDRNRLVAGVLADGRLQVTGEYQIVRPDGSPLPAGTYVTGSGPDLHILAGEEWSKIGLDDLPIARPR